MHQRQTKTDIYIKVGSFIQIVAQNRLQDKISFKQTEIVRGKLNLISLHITLSADLLMGGIFGSLWSVGQLFMVCMRDLKKPKSLIQCVIPKDIKCLKVMGML